MPELTVKHGAFEFETQIGTHKLTIDMPPENNGKDRGPTPPQLFIASLHHASQFLLQVTVTMPELMQKDYLLHCHTTNLQSHHVSKFTNRYKGDVEEQSCARTLVDLLRSSHLICSLLSVCFTYNGIYSRNTWRPFGNWGMCHYYARDPLRF